MKKEIVSGFVGALTIILIGIVVLAVHHPVDVAPVYMLNSSLISDSIQNNQIDSLRCEHIEVLRDLEAKGLLLSPADYTSHISNFYNGLIAFLIGIFALFTIGGLVAVRFTSKKEIEEVKQEIKGETREHILEQLRSMLNDSRSFQETTLNALVGRFEDRIVGHEQLEAVEKEVENIKHEIDNLKESVDMLYEFYNESENLTAANENISEE